MLRDACENAEKMLRAALPCVLMKTCFCIASVLDATEHVDQSAELHVNKNVNKPTGRRSEVRGSQHLLGDNEDGGRMKSTNKPMSTGDGSGMRAIDCGVNKLNEPTGRRR